MKTPFKFPWLKEKQAQEQLALRYAPAQDMLQNEDKIERFLQRLEKKMAHLPFGAKRLAAIPVLASLLKSYVKKEYTDLPIGTIIAIVSALIYFVSPFDLVPDLPIIGFFDDAAVVAACWKMVTSDVEEYQKWRVANHKQLDV